MILDQGPTPLYFQLKNIIKNKILSNQFKARERLPSEAGLCQEYHISRVTVRQALSELTKEGLIYRDRGKGTFVTNNAGLKHLALKGTIENLIASGKGTRIKVAEYKEAIPPPNVVKIFQLAVKQKVFQLQIVRFIPKGPFGYSFIYFQPDLGRMILRNELEELKETTEMIHFVEEKLKTQVHRANQTIDVGLANHLIAKNLLIKPKTPVLIIERDYYARDGSSMFVTITYFRSDLYKYRIELTRN